VALSDDQKALLRLLAQREQGYDDIAALMGLSVDEVRTRVKEALDAVERERADEAPAASPHPPAAQEPPPPEAPADPPAREQPKPEATPEPAPVSPPPPISSPAGKPARTLPGNQRLYAAAAGLGLIVVVIVLLATGVLGGSGSDSSSGATSKSEADNPASAETVAELTGSHKLTGAVLKPVDGGDANGVALIGRTKKEVVMGVEATGLEPSPKGSSYTIWLYKSPKLAGSSPSCPSRSPPMPRTRPRSRRRRRRTRSRPTPAPRCCAARSKARWRKSPPKQGASPAAACRGS